MNNTYQTKEIATLTVGQMVVGRYAGQTIAGVLAKEETGFAQNMYTVELATPITLFGSERTSVLVYGFAFAWRDAADMNKDFIVSASYAASNPSEMALYGIFPDETPKRSLPLFTSAPTPIGRR